MCPYLLFCRTFILLQDRQLRKPSSLSPAAAADANGGPAAGGDGADDLQARIDAAVSEARAAAEAEAGEEMEDLLACLGECLGFKGGGCVVNPDATELS